MKRDPFPLVFGIVLTTIVSATLVTAGLKAGITPGVSPLVILFAWGAFTKRLSSGGGTRFLNIAQVSGSAGMAVTSGVIFTAPLVQILYAEKGLEVPPVDYVTLIIMSLAGSLIGFGFVGLATKKFLTDPTLPAPEARACEHLIHTAVSQPDKRPRLGRSLYAGLLASFLAPLLIRMTVVADHVTLYSKKFGDAADDRDANVGVPLSPIDLGIGGLLTLATALLVFGGALGRLIGDVSLASIDPGDAETLARFPANSMRWVGGGAMTVAVAWSLFKFFVRPTAKTEAAETDEDPDILTIDRGARTLLYGCMVGGTAILCGWLFLQDGASTFSFAMSAAVLGCCSIMVALGAILSLQIGSSASPVSGTIFVTTLVLCLVALAVGRTTIDDVLLLTPLLVGACVAVCSANDSSQDYKTLQLCKVPVREGFIGQLCGLVAGSIVVPLALWLAHRNYTLGSEDLPAPQGEMFATLIDGLLIESSLPVYPILIGLVIGVAAVALDIVGGKRKVQLPAMALAVGLYLPASLGVGILVGALFRWFGERGSKRQRAESILCAAGFITGAAALDLILGVGILAGFDASRLEVTHGMSPGTLRIGAIAGILALGALLTLNSKASKDDSTF